MEAATLGSIVFERSAAGKGNYHLPRVEHFALYSVGFVETRAVCGIQVGWGGTGEGEDDFSNFLFVGRQKIAVQLLSAVCVAVL